MLLYFPFEVNQQPINLINARNTEILTRASQTIALHQTVIFYPLLVGLDLALIITELSHLHRTTKLNWRTAQGYLATALGLLLWMTNFSKFLIWPIAVVAVIGFHPTWLWHSYGRAHNWLTKQAWWPRWQSRFARWLPISLVTIVFLISNLLMFKALIRHGSWYLLWHHPMLWVNFVAELLIFLLLRALTNRIWGPALITATSYHLFYLGSLIMRKVRNDAIVPAQLSELKGLKSITTMLSPLLLGATIIVMLLGIYFARLLQHYYPAPRLHWSQRIGYLSLFALGYGSTTVWNHPNWPLSDCLTVQFKDHRQFFNPAYGARINGPWGQFLNSIDIQMMARPTGYSKLMMQTIEQRYQTKSRQLNQQRQNQLNQFTVIYNLSESYADPRRVPGVTYQGKPLAQLHAIQQASPHHGVMLSSGYGGGTANMEYMTLTSLPTTNYAPTLATPFTQIVPKFKHSYSLADRFKHTTAIHPYNTAFYDRAIDYPKLGIQTFYNITDPSHPIRHQKLIENNPYLSDQTAYDNVVDQLNRQPRPQFINLVTMQNHTPWDNKYANADRWAATANYGTDETILNQYLTGLSYTDTALKQFRATLDRQTRPIVWVFYGDHLPGFYNNPMHLDGLPLHQTDYFIYLNPAARKQAGLTELPLNTRPNTDPNEFTAAVLKLTNSQLTPFEALQTQAMQELPLKVMSTNDDETNSQSGNLQWVNPVRGQIIKRPHFTAKQTQLWHDYLLIQYDQTAGHHYLPASFFTQVNQKSSESGQRLMK